MVERTSLWRAGAVGVITLQFPGERPCFDRAAACALRDDLKVLNADADCRAVVLVGEGDFCPGGDVSRADVAGDAVIARAQGMLAAEVLREVMLAPKPVIAAIEGRAEAAGLALAAACDWVVAGAGAWFCCDAVMAGLVPDLGLLWTLPQRIGTARARRLVLTGESFTATEAAQWGLVNESVDSGQALAAALAAAARFQQVPPVALALAKAALFNGSASFDRAIRLDRDLAPLAWLSADHHEAVAAFLEKRPPRFTGA